MKGNSVNFAVAKAILVFDLLLFLSQSECLDG